MRKLALPALLALIGACAPKTIPVPIVSAPKFPDFITPAVPAALTSSRAAVNQDRGWRFLQAGDLRNAEREFAAALKVAPAFFPAESGIGYVDLARKDARSALPHFDAVLEQQKGDLSALVGRGQALVALGRESDAQVAYAAALVVDPSLADIARRVEVLKFRDLEGALSRARQAARAGRADQAISAYTGAIAGSPDSPFLYRELAAVERQQGEVDRALEHFRQAVALEPVDAASLVQIGEILESRADFDGAVKAYSDSLAVEANADVEAKLENLRRRAELAQLPAEYRAIDSAAQVTRADLAALIGVRLAPLLQASRRQNAVLITDFRNTWASIWIMSVARAGVMDPFANHAFEPRTAVRRIDLAQVVGRLLAKVVEVNPGQPRTWQAARLKFSDLPPGHLAHPAASAAVASGVMTTGADTSFQPSRLVSGAEAVEVINGIEAVAGLTRGKGPGGR